MRPRQQRRKLAAASVLLACSFLLGVSGPGSGETLLVSDGSVTVNQWGYVLQGPGGLPLQVTPLAAADYHLLVMDFSQDGTESEKFSPAEVNQIQNSAPALGGDGHRKVVSAYVSIGEASEFRSYWDAAWTENGSAGSPLTAEAPDWLGPVNPFFPESRKVRFWDPDWQSIIFNTEGTGWLDQVVAQGFDSAYLDIIDAFYFWGEEVSPGEFQPGDPVDLQDSARRMIDFVVALTLHARQTSPFFFAIPQNGAFLMSDSDFGGSLPEDPVRRTAYLDAIGAIGVEDTYFVGDLAENNAFEPDLEKADILKLDYVAVGVPVFVVDYVNEPAKVAQFYSEALDDDFIPYAAPSRDLDVLGAAVSVPEPNGTLLVGAGLVPLLWLSRRRQRNQFGKTAQSREGGGSNQSLS
ncbi:MAG: endo alpha-1,4 polygalactosaminidase, partial [Verrucomicrobiota bacterium]|nr:endo alpha-1,4 polygalactosaminidase [Verrucomicrobiota bacterium]